MQCVLQCPTVELITHKETRRDFALTQDFLTLLLSPPPIQEDTLSLRGVSAPTKSVPRLSFNVIKFVHDVILHLEPYRSG